MRTIKSCWKVLEAQPLDSSGSSFPTLRRQLKESSTNLLSRSRHSSVSHYPSPSPVTRTQCHEKQSAMDQQDSGSVRVALGDTVMSGFHLNSDRMASCYVSQEHTLSCVRPHFFLSLFFIFRKGVIHMCVFSCVYVCMYVCMNECMMNACMYECLHVCI